MRQMSLDKAIVADVEGQQLSQREQICPFNCSRIRNILDRFFLPTWPIERIDNLLIGECLNKIQHLPAHGIVRKLSFGAVPFAKYIPRLFKDGQKSQNRIE